MFNSIALFGYRGAARTDRDDRMTGVFRDSPAAYPYALMRAEQTRFHRGLTARAYFGFDVAHQSRDAWPFLAEVRPFHEPW